MLSVARALVCACILAALATSGGIRASVDTGSDGNSLFSVTPAGLSGWTVDHVSHLYEGAFYYRLPGEAAQPVSALTLDWRQQVAANRFHYQYASPDGFNIDVFYTLAGGSMGSGHGELEVDLSVTNFTGAAIDLTVFSYFDFDVGGQASNDGVTGGTEGLTIRSGIHEVFLTSSPPGSRFQVEAYPVLKTGFEEGFFTELLTNTGTPFGPGDAQVAIQHDLAGIPSSGNAGFTVTAVAIPEPAAAAALAGCVAAGLLLWRRRPRSTFRVRAGRLLLFLAIPVALSLPFRADAALVFDGSSGAGNVPHASALNFSSLTIEAWVKPEGDGERTLLRKGPGYGLALGPDNRLLFFLGGTLTLTSADSLQNGQWQHVAVSVDPAVPRTAFYIDGEPAGVWNQAVVANNSSPLTIGLGAKEGTGFQGEIAEVRLWNTPRSSAAIAEMAFRHLVQPESDPALSGYWRLEETAGTTAADSSGNGRDATLVDLTDDAWSEPDYPDHWLPPVPPGELPLVMDPASAGLWIGEVTATGVSEALQTSAGEAAETTPVSNPAGFRILFHVDRDGVVRLLKEVTVMRRSESDEDEPQFVLLTDETLIPGYAGVAVRGETLVGLRYSTAAFDFEGQTVEFLGGIGEGTACAGEIVLPYDHPTNPFRHKFHPDWSNEPESGFSLTRQIRIQFPDPPAGNAATLADVLQGTYREVLHGLHRVPLTVEGTVTLTRISDVDVLNDQ